MEATNIIKFNPERQQLKQAMRQYTPHPYRLADSLFPASWVFLSGPMAQGYQLSIENLSCTKNAVVSVYTESQGWLMNSEILPHGCKRVLTYVDMGKHAVYVANLTDTAERQPIVSFSLNVPSHLAR